MAEANMQEAAEVCIIPFGRSWIEKNGLEQLDHELREVICLLLAQVGEVNPEMVQHGLGDGWSVGCTEKCASGTDNERQPRIGWERSGAEEDSFNDCIFDRRDRLEVRTQASHQIICDLRRNRFEQGPACRKIAVHGLSSDPELARDHSEGCFIAVHLNAGHPGCRDSAIASASVAGGLPPQPRVLMCPIVRDRNDRGRVTSAGTRDEC